MKITGFQIENFKGIRNASIRFAENDTARVHTLVGLNESGKTTLLEAIHSFSPDAETRLVVKSARTVLEQQEQWVPRDKISIFTGEVSITAHVEATDADWSEVCRRYKQKTNLDCQAGCLKPSFTVRLVHKYKNGDFVSTTRNLSHDDLRVKTPRANNFRAPKPEEVREFGRLVQAALPTVAYYPTFVFDFPKKIYLTKKDQSPRNRFYAQLFQDILDYDGSGYTIEDSILARLHKEENKGVWEKWFTGFAGTTEEEKVRQVISRAERAVTELVFSKWNEVFGEEAGAKEIRIDLQYEKGDLVKNEDGSEEEPTIHDAYIRFSIQDGSSRYSVDDRSLGFRWFFSFLLFTQFRIHRDLQKPTIFLFDEPASNLHAAAQMKLLESFPAIAKTPHRLIYSTHSHYMVEPKWLEQAYIVFDRSAVPDARIIDESVRADSQVDIQAIPYRQFVNERPHDTSYFQPILDTLEVQPSRFDYKVGGLIVEGKSDFYFLKVCTEVLQIDLGPIFPAKGSGTMGALVALHRGWGLPVRVLFDTDQGGRDGQKNLGSEFSLAAHECTNLKALAPKLTTIEDILNDEDQSLLMASIKSATKSQLLRRVQELLAAGQLPSFSTETRERMKTLLDEVQVFATPDVSTPDSPSK
jgi:ABC-type Na+ transport system ATPase subunit NatA